METLKQSQMGHSHTELDTLKIDWFTQDSYQAAHTPLSGGPKGPLQGPHGGHPHPPEGGGGSGTHTGPFRTAALFLYSLIVPGTASRVFTTTISEYYRTLFYPVSYTPYEPHTRPLRGALWTPCGRPMGPLRQDPRGFSLFRLSVSDGTTTAALSSTVSFPAVLPFRTAPTGRLWGAYKAPMGALPHRLGRPLSPSFL
jgi:hypothetical protein